MKIMKTLLYTLLVLLITVVCVEGASQTFHVLHIPINADSMYVYDLPTDGGTETSAWYIGDAKIDTFITLADNTKKELIIKNYGAGYADSGSATVYPLNNLYSSQAFWGYGSGRSLSEFGFSVTVGTNNDKTGYSISGTKTTLDAMNDFDNSSDKVTLVDTSAATISEMDAMLDTLGIIAGWFPGTNSRTHYTADSDYILIITPNTDTLFRITLYHIGGAVGGAPDTVKVTRE